MELIFKLRAALPTDSLLTKVIALNHSMYND